MRTDTLVKHDALNIFNEHLGLIDTERFISLVLHEPFDYTKWHENLDDEISVRELSKKAMEYQKNL
jgi:hypothetical protein